MTQDDSPHLTMFTCRRTKPRFPTHVGRGEYGMTHSFPSRIQQWKIRVCHDKAPGKTSLQAALS